MSKAEQNLENMLAVWNTTDAAEKATLVTSALEHNVHFVDLTAKAGLRAHGDQMVAKARLAPVAREELSKA